MNQFSAKQEIIKVGAFLWEKGMVSSNEGNLSIQLEDSKVLITPSGVSKGFLTTDQLIILNSDWSPIYPKVPKITSEFKLHKTIYENTGYTAVCHAHPPYSTSFAASSKGIPSCLLPEMILSVGAIPLVPYAAPSTEGVGKNIIPFLKDGYEVFLLQNHGVLTLGKTLTDAYFKMEMVEHYSKIVHLNFLSGDVKLLTKNEIEELNTIRNNLWKKPGNVICDVCGYCKILEGGEK